MALQLQDTLDALGRSQRDLARSLNCSPATISQLCRHGHWPRSGGRDWWQQRIVATLTEWTGVEPTEDVFEEKPDPRANTDRADTPAVPSTTEDNEMLLAYEALSQQARDHFNLDRSPFADDIASLADVFSSPATRRARAALMDAALNSGFVALVGESGSGKTILREELEERILVEARPVRVIKPYVVEMERSERRGRPMWAGQISEAIVRELDPSTSVRVSTQARNRQVRDLLAASQQAGYHNLLIIEEAHSLPVTTLRALKRYLELKVGLRRLLGVVLIGQPELLETLNVANGDVREIVQRCEIRELRALDDDLVAYLTHKFARCGKPLADVLSDDALDAIRTRLIWRPRGASLAEARSICYPLAVNNLVARGMNAAAAVALPRVTGDVVRGV